MVEHVSNIGPGAGGPVRKQKNVYHFDEPKRPEDAVHLSSDVMKLRGVEGVRMDKVMEVKRAIANGTYLTPEKLDKALDRAIDDATAE